MDGIRSKFGCFCLLVTIGLFPLWGLGQAYKAEDSVRVTAILAAMNGKDLEAGLHLADSAAQVAKATNFDGGRLRALTKKGILLENKGKFLAAKEVYLQGLHLADSLARPMGRASFHDHLGTLERRLGNYPEALQQHQRAAAILDSIHAYTEAIGVSNNIAIIYKAQGDEAAAMAEYRKARDRAWQVQSFGPYTAALTNICLLHLRHDALDSARLGLDEVICVTEREGLVLRNAQALSIYSDLHKKEHDYPAAIQDLKLASERVAGLDEDFFKASLVLMEGDLYRQMGKVAPAREKLQAAVREAERLQAPELEKSAREWLAMLEESTGNYKAALDHYHHFMNLRDSLTGAESKAEVARLREQYEQEKSQRKIAQLNLALEQETLAGQRRELDLARSRNNFLVALAMAVALAAVAIFLVSRFRQKNKEARLLLEKQSLVERSLAEKEVLLAEVHHRVKNNLQVIYNLLDMQSRTIDGEGRAALQESMGRISSMALIHHELYQADHLGGVPMPEYVARLVGQLQQSLVGATQQVTVHAEVAPLLLDLDTAIPLGILINELVTNALKHAFPVGASGVVTVRLRSEAQLLVLEVQDSGQGKTGSGDARSFGMRLVQSLARQLRARVTEATEQGTLIRLEIQQFKVIQP